MICASLCYKQTIVNKYNVLLLHTSLPNEKEEVKNYPFWQIVGVIGFATCVTTILGRYNIICATSYVDGGQFPYVLGLVTFDLNSFKNNNFCGNEW